MISAFVHHLVIGLVIEAEIFWWYSFIDGHNVVWCDHYSIAVSEELDDIDDNPDFLPSVGIALLVGLTW